ncbi:MAG: hypothetical protein ACXVCP_20000 [Bdellovibrio sp.]
MVSMLRWKEGRDFYDYVWYLKNNVPVRPSYLSDKAIQSGHCTQEDLRDVEQLKVKLMERFNSVDFDAAKNDVLPFIKNPDEISLWSADFFCQITEKILAT